MNWKRFIPGPWTLLFLETILIWGTIAYYGYLIYKGGYTDQIRMYRVYP